MAAIVAAAAASATTSSTSSKRSVLLAAIEAKNLESLKEILAANGCKTLLHNGLDGIQSDSSARSVGVVVDAKAAAEDHHLPNRNGINGSSRDGDDAGLEDGETVAQQQSQQQPTENRRSRLQTLDQLSEASRCPLQLAALSGYTPAITELVKHGVDINLQTQSAGLTALHCASLKGHTDAVSVIVEKGGAMNLQDHYGRTPLFIACTHGHGDSVACLVRHGAKMDIPATSGIENGRTPLHAACSGGHTHIVEQLLKAGSPTSHQDVTGNTPMHLCILNGRVDCARLLKSHNADTNLRNAEGSTPLLALLSQELKPTEQQLEIATMLIKCSNLSLLNAQGVAAIHRAAYWEEVSLLEDMSKFSFEPNLRDSQGRTALHHCFLPTNPSVEAAKCLVNLGCDVTLRDNSKRTALDKLLEHQENPSAEIAELIADWAKGASDKEFGKTLLHLSVTSGNMDIIKNLLNSRVDIDAQDTNGNSALHLATIGAKVDIIRILIQDGASVNLQNKQHQSPLHLAAILPNATPIEILMEAGASIGMKEENGMNCLHKASGWGRLCTVQYLIHQGAVVNELDYRGQRPLHLASEEGKLDIVEFLISCGAKTSVQDKDGKTPLHLCAKGGHEEIATHLLDSGAEVNLVDKNNQTPLHVACYFGRRKCVETLLAGGANVKVCDSQSQTPVSIATEMGYSDIVELLKEHSIKIAAYSRQNSQVKASTSGESGVQVSPQVASVEMVTAEETVEGVRGGSVCECCVVM